MYLCTWFYFSVHMCVLCKFSGNFCFFLYCSTATAQAFTYPLGTNKVILNDKHYTDRKNHYLTLLESLFICKMIMMRSMFIFIQLFKVSPLMLHVILLLYQPLFKLEACGDINWTELAHHACELRTVHNQCGRVWFSVVSFFKCHLFARASQITVEEFGLSLSMQTDATRCL